jgi:site-specific DNA-adenine methylase
MTYGMPYMGSKSKIAKDIIRLLPSAEYFVDLFGGGVYKFMCFTI